MRFVVLLILACAIAGGYVHFFAPGVCRVPIAYSIGSIDERFELTPEEATTLAREAESLWEVPIGKELFTYDPEAAFAISFVYDARQQTTDAEAVFREELREKKLTNEALRGEYEAYVAEYEKLSERYEESVALYEERLRAHNATVASWNAKGGAPEEEFRAIEKEEAALTAMQGALTKTAKELNVLVGRINAIGEAGNEVAETYNEVVDVYNSRFGTEREFTQGDYNGDSIHIYQYGDFDELRIVLAHEFGHALSLPHVENEKSVMFHFMEEQTLEGGVTAEDLAAFERVCNKPSIFGWFRGLILGRA